MPKNRSNGKHASMETHDNDRLTELEIRLAWQSELIDSLNDSIARMRRELDLQQAQLRLLYRRLEDKNTDPAHTTQERPPHY